MEANKWPGKDIHDKIKHWDERVMWTRNRVIGVQLDKALGGVLEADEVDWGWYTLDEGEDVKNGGTVHIIAGAHLYTLPWTLGNSGYQGYAIPGALRVEPLRVRSVEVEQQYRAREDETLDDPPLHVRVRVERQEGKALEFGTDWHSYYGTDEPAGKVILAVAKKLAAQAK